MSRRILLPPVTVPIAQVDALVERLARGRIGESFNQYTDSEAGTDGATRRHRLRSYLTARWNAPLLFVGEAPGYLGCRLSGVPFTSLRQLGEGSTTESSSTVVHDLLEKLDIEEQVLL